MFFNRTSPNQFIVRNYRYIGSTPLLASEINRCLWLKPDGTKIFFMGTSAGILRSYDLTEPWNILTVTNAQSSSARLVDTGSIAISPYSMAFNSSGTVLFVGDAVSGPLYKYSLSNPWDISSINLTASQQTFNSNVTGANSMWFGNNDSTLTIYTTGSAPSFKVNNISSSLDLSTITLNSNNASAGSNIPSANFVDNGNKICIGTSAGGSAAVAMYNVTSPYQFVGVSTLYSIGTIDGTALINTIGVNGLGEIWMSNDGNYLYMISLSSGVRRIFMWMVG